MSFGIDRAVMVAALSTPMEIPSAKGETEKGDDSVSVMHLSLCGRSFVNDMPPMKIKTDVSKKNLFIYLLNSYMITDAACATFRLSILGLSDFVPIPAKGMMISSSQLR